MADAAAARREARRKRILENSHNRLEFIAGKKSSEECSRESPSKYSSSDQVFETSAAASTQKIETLSPVYKGVFSPEPEPYTFLPESHNQSPPGDSEITNDLAASVFPSQIEEKKEKSRLEILFTYKYDVVLLSLILQVLYNLFIFESTYFFLPLVMYTVTKFIWFPATSNFNFANAVLLMNGISANKAKRIMNVSHWVAAISQDICVYLFTTICIQSLLLQLNNYFEVI